MRGTGEYLIEAERTGNRPGRETIGCGSVTQGAFATVAPTVCLAGCGGGAGVIPARVSRAKSMAPQTRRRLEENSAVAGLTVAGLAPAIRHARGTDGTGMGTSCRELPVGYAHIGHWIG